VPTAPEQPSLNLAQAVMVYAYELQLASRMSGRTPEAEPRATEALLAQVEHALREVLERSQFADPDRPGHGVAELAHGLRRAGLSEAEARLWQAALRRAVDALRGK
jgi:tRNA/rRNA methyltransferase/tRNA (cytidine32/uridine32-2'-O)-methyltransferase